MSVQARVNNLFGGTDNSVTVTATSNGTLEIPPIATWINVTSASAVTVGNTTTVPVFSMPSFSRGRLLFFYNSNPSGGSIITFTSNNNTTSPGYMDLGANRALDPTDLLCVYVRPDGTAVRVFSTLDN